jgi:hypothetical protein
VAIRISDSTTANIEFVNSLIANNRSGHNYGAPGVRVYNNGPGSTFTLSLTNTTVTGNRSRDDYAGIWMGGGGGGMMTLNLTNTILWGNRPGRPGWGADLGVGEDTASGTVTINASHSDLGDVNPGVGTLNLLGGNLNTAPLLVGARDFHLAAGSPLIDAGTNAGAPASDFEGDSRPLDGDGDTAAVTDIGADEFVP